MRSALVLLALAVSASAAFGTADATPEAALSVKATKESITTSEKSVVMVLVLKNVGQVSLTVVRSWLGGQYEVKYVPDLTDRVRKSNTWTRGILGGTTHSGEAPRYDPAEYTLIAPGKDFRTEVDVGSFLRGLTPEGLMPGSYFLTFWYSYEPNDAERDLALLEGASFAEPVRITVSTK
jgi:hypothetical protein